MVERMIDGLARVFLVLLMIGTGLAAWLLAAQQVEIDARLDALEATQERSE